MKKFTAMFLMLLPLSVLADEFIISPPEWKDFAPTAFVNVKEPRGLGKLNVTAKYWYQRRVNFDKAIDACKELETNRELYKCYENVKVSQYAQNSEYNARLEAQNNPQLQEMQNPTDTMLPIGNYINNITRNMPNEFH